MYDNETDEKVLNEMFSGEPHPHVIFLNSGLWDLLYGDGYAGYVKGIRFNLTKQKTYSAAKVWMTLSVLSANIRGKNPVN